MVKEKTDSFRGLNIVAITCTVHGRSYYERRVFKVFKTRKCLYDIRRASNEIISTDLRRTDCAKDCLL